MALYQGETITIKVSFKDDDGVAIPNIDNYTPTVVLYNKLRPSDALTFQEDQMTIDSEVSTITLIITAAQSANLSGLTTIEIRLTDGSGSLIGQVKEAFEVLPTIISQH